MAQRSFPPYARSSWLLPLVCLVLFVTGCTHLFVVESDPVGAEVFVSVNAQGEKKVLGTTPLSLPMTDVRAVLGEEVAAGEYFTVGVAKSGFVTQTLSVPASAAGTVVTDLKIKLKESNLALEERKAKEIVDRLFLAQRFALSKQYERAQIELDKILADFPNFARAMSMRASIYYAQKDWKESLKWYENAIKADPQMEEAVKMAVRVREVMAAGGDLTRIPASSLAPSSAPNAPDAAPAVGPAGGQKP